VYSTVPTAAERAGDLSSLGRSIIDPGTNPTPQEIIRRYAPAITATGSGLFMALINLLPTWVVLLGRELIQTLGGEAALPSGENLP